MAFLLPFHVKSSKQPKAVVVGGNNGVAKRMLLTLGILVLTTLVVSNFSLLRDLSFQGYCSAGSIYHTPGPTDVPPTHLHPLPLNATLEERLYAFRNSPGVGWEPATFVKWNLESCSNIIPNHNRDLLSKSSLTWAALNSTAIQQHRESMSQYLLQKKKEGALEPLHISQGGRGLIGQDRGIVFTAGNGNTLTRVLYTLRLLRSHLKCFLPVAIFHFPGEGVPEDSPIHKELEMLNAKLVRAAGRTRDPTREKNYHLKAQSIIEAEWAEVLYLDSDNLPAANPELLFEMDNYKRLGMFFTPDYWKTSASNPIWQILGVQCRDEWEQEAGQIVVDKRRHLDVMLLAGYMLQEWEWWFNFSDGDKDVFRFAALALRKRWALPGRYVGGGGLPRGTPSGDFCAHTMQQYDDKGRPMFIHYNLLKQIPSGVYRGFTWGRTKQVTSYPQPPLTPKHNQTLMENDRVLYPDPVIRDATDVEADMLANADDDGMTIYPGTPEVRRRAALERGIRPFFHGGGHSAFCIDMTWEDPAPWKRRRVFDEDGGDDKKDEKWESGEELGIDWDNPPLEVVQWSDDERLRDFENVVYNLGFEPSHPQRL